MLFNTTKSYHCWKKRKAFPCFSSPCWFFFSLNSCTAVLSTPPSSVLLVFRFVQIIESVRAVCCTTNSRQEPFLYFMWLLLPGVVHRRGPGFRDALCENTIKYWCIYLWWKIKDILPGETCLLQVCGIKATLRTDGGQGQLSQSFI